MKVNDLALIILVYEY